MNHDRPALLVATKNVGKLAEFERILGHAFRIEGLDGISLEMPPEGTGSYKENAEMKARFVAQHTGRLTLGDDSGIEVFALDGRPGIVSARYAGVPVSDERNIERVLAELDGRDAIERSARFVCWLSLADPDGVVRSVEGTCSGTIGYEPKGTNGFGYDPVFVFPNGRTMAELTDEEKDAVSHRGNAIRAMLPELARIVVDGDDNA